MERYLKDVLGSRKFEDVCTTRSRTMAAIRGKGNKSTELRLRMALVRLGIAGWHLHSRALPGKPDFFFENERVAVFVDGCFWHGCPKCGHTPKTRSAFWVAKFERNKERDRRNVRSLMNSGIEVVRLWEHQLKSPQGLAGAVRRIQKKREQKRNICL